MLTQYWRCIMTVKKCIAFIADYLSHLCIWKIKTDYSKARETLFSFSPKPQGCCYTENKQEIKYDLQVIIPAYNAERYIDQCLSSVEQLLNCDRNILIQVIDDGSTDQTLEIIKRFVEKAGKNVCVIHQDNKGLSDSRNTALRTLQGEYVMFIDSDDYLPGGFDITHLIDEAKNIDLLQGDWLTVDKENQPLERKTTSQFSGYAWGKIYHHTVFKNVKFPEGYWFEDTLIKFILGGLGLKTKKLDDIVYCYRINPDGITAKALNEPKTADTYWITELCLEEYPAFEIEYDQKALDYLLTQSIINQIRVRRLPRKIRKAIFTLTVELIEKYFHNQVSTNHNRIEKAIRDKQFMKFELLAIAGWCR